MIEDQVNTYAADGSLNLNSVMDSYLEEMDIQIWQYTVIITETSKFTAAEFSFNSQKQELTVTPCCRLVLPTSPFSFMPLKIK